MSVESAQVDAAVVGAGPTGLTLACLLAAEGIKVAVIDRSRLPISHPRATHLDDETMRTFQTLGLQDLGRTFSPVGIYRFYDPKWRPVMAMAMDRGVTDQGWRSDYMFHQPDFEAVLRGRLMEDQNVEVIFGSEVSDLTEHEGGVEVSMRELSTGEERHLTAAFAVGCDGSNSLVSSKMETTVTDYDATHCSLIVDILPFAHPAELPERDAFIQAGVRNPLTYIPIASPRLRFELMLRPDDEIAAFERIDRVQALLEPWLKADQYRVLRADVYEWHSTVTAPWRSGRLLLAGDAAHEMPPHLGQGMCSGVRDALNLAWKLGRVVRGESPPALLETYETERSPHVATLVGISAQMANEVESMQPEGSAAGDDPPVKEAQPVRPPLGPGIHVDGEVAGSLAAQPTLDDGTLMDEALGYRFAVVGDPACMAAVSDDTRSLWHRLGVVSLDGQHAEVSRWLTTIKANAVVLRPDRYVFGIADTRDDLESLTHQLESQLSHEQIKAG